MERKKAKQDVNFTRAGGAYIPPAKLKMLQEQIADKSSEQYQRLAWEHLKMRIHGTVNKVNAANITKVVTELLKENIVRGKGLFARSIIQAQAASPTFSDVFAALVSIINSKFPHIGELIIRRLCIQFKRSFARNDKQVAISASKFIAHLTNQQVVHELLALEILTLLLENATDDSVEVAVAFIKECGAKLSLLSPRGVDETPFKSTELHNHIKSLIKINKANETQSLSIFQSFRSILQNETVDKRIQYMIEDFPTVKPELDLVEEEDKITHTIALDDFVDPENKLNIFRLDPEFQKNERIYEEIRKEILGEDEGESGEEDEDEDEEAEAENEGENKPKTVIIDNTEANLIAFRRTVYLAIQSSLDYQEAIHKLFKMQISPEMQVELCHMILDCCAQNRTYEKFYGLMAERICRLKKEYQQFYEQLFKDSYDTVHRLEITKLRNVTKFFAHLLFSDAISWAVLSHIKLTEIDTTSAGRVFIKILFQELCEYLGLEKLYARVQDPTMQAAFDGLFPRDNPLDTRFSINFFTSIGLGGLTADLREHLQKGVSKPAVSLPEPPNNNKSVKADVPSESEDSSSESSSSSSEEPPKRRKTKEDKKQKETERHKKSKESSKRQKSGREFKKSSIKKSKR